MAEQQPAGRRSARDCGMKQTSLRDSKHGISGGVNFLPPSLTQYFWLASARGPVSTIKKATYRLSDVLPVLIKIVFRRKRAQETGLG